MEARVQGEQLSFTFDYGQYNADHENRRVDGFVWVLRLSGTVLATTPPGTCGISRPLAQLPRNGVLVVEVSSKHPDRLIDAAEINLAGILLSGTNSAHPGTGDSAGAVEGAVQEETDLHGGEQADQQWCSSDDSVHSEHPVSPVPEPQQDQQQEQLPEQSQTRPKEEPQEQQRGQPEEQSQPQAHQQQPLQVAREDTLSEPPSQEAPPTEFVRLLVVRYSNTAAVPYEAKILNYCSDARVEGLCIFGRLRRPNGGVDYVPSRARVETAAGMASFRVVFDKADAGKLMYARVTLQGGLFQMVQLTYQPVCGGATVAGPIRALYYDIVHNSVEEVGLSVGDNGVLMELQESGASIGLDLPAFFCFNNAARDYSMFVDANIADSELCNCSYADVHHLRLNALLRNLQMFGVNIRGVVSGGIFDEESLGALSEKIDGFQMDVERFLFLVNNGHVTYICYFETVDALDQAVHTMMDGQGMLYPSDYVDADGERRIMGATKESLCCHPWNVIRTRALETRDVVTLRGRTIVVGDSVEQDALILYCGRKNWLIRSAHCRAGEIQVPAECLGLQVYCVSSCCTIHLGVTERLSLPKLPFKCPCAIGGEATTLRIAKGGVVSYLDTKLAQGQYTVALGEAEATVVVSGGEYQDELIFQDGTAASTAFQQLRTASGV